MSLLHIGDIISLYSDGFLSTLGLVDDRCVLQPSKDEENEHEIHPPKKFRDCLFKVCNQHKYDVQSELWRSGQIEEELYKKLYAAAKSEQDSNQEKNQLKKGTVVKYEDTIQLLHIKSNKYITVNTKAAAPCDKNAIRVYLDSNGNEGSWLKVKSPYKYRSNGEDVVCESIALVSELIGALNHEDALYLHASTFPLPDNPDCLEINANRQSTSWDVKPFLDYTEDLEDFLKGGDVVRLFHTDQEKFLTMDTYNNQETQHVFLRSTDRAKATSATSSKALWEVEVVEQDPCRAGLARWNSLIRLKHLATERFLAAEQDDDPTPDSMREKLRHKGREVYKLISIEFSCDLATLFEFDPTTMNVNKDAYIPIHSNITLKHLSTSTYAHSTNIYIDKEKKKSCMSKVGCAHQKGLDEVFAVIPVSATEIRDLDFVYDACMLLDESFDLIQQNDTVGRIEAHRKLAELLPEIIHFIANKESEPRKIEKALSMIAENPNRERQKLLREQNVLKVLFDILKLEDGLNANKDICRLCYRVLRLSFQNYRKNQEYIVGYDEFMQDQFGKDISAESTYSTLFHSNKNLLEKHVNKVDIDKFINLIRLKRQSHFLDCLSDLCITCNGSVSSQTQKLICESILYEESNNSDILIDTIQSDENQIFLSTEHWSTFEGYNFAKEVRCFRKPLIDIVLAARNKSEMDIFIFDYYRHQIDLFSAMCVSRQTKAISILSEKLSLQLIQQCISDARLPYELRASFCRLLLHLYLIVEPRKPVSPVNLRRHWKDVHTNIKVDVDIYDHHHDRDSNLKHFDTTMEFVELYLSDLTSLSSRSSPSIYYNNERNKLTFEVINLTRELTYFGFYRLSDFLRLAETLLIVLEDEKNQQKLVMKTKTKIIEILQYMSEVRLDYMITCLLTIFKSNQKLNHKGDLIDTSNQTAKNIHQALDKHSKKVNLDGKSGKKFVSVLLHLVKHDCPDLVSASLELLLNFRSQRNRILETFRKIELINSTSDIQESFWKIHPLIEQLNKYHRNGRDENHNVVNEVLVKESKLVSFIVQHIQYLIRNKDEERLTRDLLRLLKDLIPLDGIQGVSMSCNSNDSSNSSNRNSNSNGNNSNSNGNSNGSDKYNKQINGFTNNITKNNEQLSEDLKRKINESIPTMDDVQSVTISCNSISSNSSNSNSSGKLNKQNSSSTNNRNKNDVFVSSIEPSEIQNKLDTHGTSSLVVELIAMGSSCCEEKVRERSAAVFNDTIALGIALLDGGNQLIQSSIYDKLTRKNELDKSERFFEVLGNRMSLAMQALSPTGSSNCSKSNNNYMGPILRLLQLLCEDHNLTMQNFIHSQVLNKTSYNLVAKTLVFLNCLCGSKEGSLGHKLGEYIKENNVDLINQTLRTLTEYCQGPCVENQRCILMHESNGIDMIRSLILDNIEPLDNLRMDLVLELKDNASKLLLALMESCSDPQHAGRILREASLTNKLINVAINYYHEQDDYDDSFAEFSNEEVLSSADGIVRPRDVGHKVFILCHQLVQQYNLIHQTVQTSAKIPTSCECLALANKGSINTTTFNNINEFQQQQSSSSTTSGCASERDVHLREATALRYYESHTAQIEIVRGNRQMERVVFPVPLICEYLTHETKLNIYHNTEQDERGSKIPNFFSSIDDLFDEMKWQRELQTNPILHSIARYMSLWSSVEFKLSCLVTVLVLFCVSKQQQHLNLNHNHHHNHHHQQQQEQQHQQYQHEDISSSVAAAAAAAATGCYADVTSAAANAFVEKVAAAAATMASAAAAGTCTGNSATTTAAAAAAAGNHSMSGSGSSFLPSSVNTLLAIACSTFFVFKPRIAHSWTLFLVCTTLYLAQVVGECNSLKILGLFLEAVTMMHLFSVLINKGYINKPIQQLLTETDVLYHGGYLLICTLGLILNPLFYPFLLPPSLIRREETLRNVIKSVTKNAYSILMTGFLGLIIILLYTIIDYLFFGEDFIIDIDDGSSSSSPYKPCLGTLWECYVAHVNYGLRDGGGIGERIRDTRLDLTLLNVLRLVCIMSFFLVVNLMILQLVYCIIVDTFATLRGEKQQKEEVLRNTCFVCGLDRSSFENRQTTFEDHIRSEHNLWHYLYFIVLIKTKSRTELSGPESLVHDMIKNKDHSWFPRMRAMSLNKEEQVGGAVYSN